MSRREVKVVLSGDSSGAEAAFGRGAVSLEAFHNAAQTGITRLTTLQGVVAGLASGAFASMVLSTMEGLDALNDFADATGTSVEMASALEDVAKRTGTSLDTVAGIVVKLNGYLKEAKAGSQQEAVLRAIGLSAEELRRLDPAQAIKQVADALAGFADDGQKARVVQELFGKSVREAAPLLKDLAEQGELNAKVTKAQADEAERFNRQLAEFAKTAEDARRGILGKLVPAFNELVARYQLASEVFGGFGGVVKEFFGGTFRFTTDEAGLKEFQDRVAGINKEIAELQAKKAGQKGYLNFIDQGALSKALKDAAALQRYIDFFQANIDRRKALNSPAPVEDRPSAGDIPDKPEVPTAAKESEVQKYIRSLMEATVQVAELSEVEKLRFEMKGRMAGATKAELELAEVFAKGLDDLRAKTKLMGPSDEELFAGASAMRKQIESLVSDTDTARIEKLAEQIEVLKKALDDPDLAALRPAISEKLTSLGEEAKRLGGVLEGAGDELTEFAKQAQRNIQSALADTLVDTFTGATDKIVDRWVQMLIRLVAEAKAAELAKNLLGAGTTIGQWLGVGSGGAPAGAASAPGLGTSGAPPLGGLSKAGAGTGGLKVEVINNAGAEVTPQMSDAGTLQIIVDRAVAAVDQRIAAGGSTRKAIAGAFAIKPALSRRG